MNAENLLSGTASLFLALGDKTRLRLLNLMRDREICVSSFTGTLGQSQPKISRHLAYLRNAGIVEVRRDGKWIHYRISSNLDANSSRLLSELFKWMDDQDGLTKERDRHDSKFGAPVEVVEEKVVPSRSPKRTIASPKPRAAAVRPMPEPEEVRYTEPEEPHYAHHNELEDFLL